jgi:hypothetical protein
MKRFFWSMFVFSAALAACWSETDTGIAYGMDPGIFTTQASFSLIDLWVAGSPEGVFLDHFLFTDRKFGKGPVVFTATRGLSFKCYTEPFFGTVADIWLEGLFGNSVGGGGRPVIAHYRMTDPAGRSRQYNYYTIDIYLPDNLTTPIFSRIGVGRDLTSVLCHDPGAVAGGQGVSSVGLAYSPKYRGETLYEVMSAEYRVYSNGILKFLFSASNGGIDDILGVVGSRLRSFECTNNGFFGKQAEFWMDAYVGSTLKTAYTPVVARVIVTASLFPHGVEFMYIALYDRRDLTSPIYERLWIGGSGQNHILCK